ncbi:MAG: RusA family crossover junction endodeoxyribonuclease [Clostridium sp.]
MLPYAKVIVLGSPISKSNFKLHNKSGRAILPSNTGQSHDKYALYEEEIAYYARSQNPNIVLDEALIAILKVYYKSDKRHPDTANITKSIFDGIEKSGLIVNDAQIRKIVTEEFYDKENPRFELEFYGESKFEISYTVKEKEIFHEKILYKPITSGKVGQTKSKTIESNPTNSKVLCEFCKKSITESNPIKANGGKTLICRPCFTKLF